LRQRAKSMKISETLLWILGTTLLACYFGGVYWGEHQRREGLASFTEVRQTAPYEWRRDAPSREEPSVVATSAELPAVPDTSAVEYAVLAVLRIPGIELEVPVYHGTTEQSLRRGAGLVEGTALPGSAGNVGIAAHRDTHFRGLKDVAIGDVVELGTPDETRVYRITMLEVVGPGDVHVLDDTGEPTLTLVTCYPFYFVGNAPKRYIVQATVADGSR
jgi:sortase A